MTNEIVCYQYKAVYDCKRLSDAFSDRQPEWMNEFGAFTYTPICGWKIKFKPIEYAAPKMMDAFINKLFTILPPAY